MKASEAIKEIQEAILEVEKSGAKEISIANLNTYLAAFLTTADDRESAAPTITEAQATHQLEVWKAELSARTTLSAELLKSTMEAGQTALRSAILINGGAAAMILAFAGNAITKGQLQAGGPLLSQIGKAMLWFMVGVGSAGLAAGFRYLSQLGYSQANAPKANPNWIRTGTFSNWISILLGASSFVVFFIGGVAAYHAVVVPEPKAAPVVARSNNAREAPPVAASAIQPATTNK